MIEDDSKLLRDMKLLNTFFMKTNAKLMGNQDIKISGKNTIYFNISGTTIVDTLNGVFNLEYIKNENYEIYIELVIRFRSFIQYMDIDIESILNYITGSMDDILNILDVDVYVAEALKIESIKDATELMQMLIIANFINIVLKE